MTNKQHDKPREMDHMMQCSDKMTFGLPIDICRATHKLSLTKY
jgi:hypothetical protein